MWNIDGASINAVAVVDDDPDGRSSMEWVLSDAALATKTIDGPLDSLEGAEKLVFDGADALICDHHLSIRNYAGFTGAQLVARSTRAGRLAVLCTKFIGTELDEIRPLMADLPVVRRPDELNEPDELYWALKTCAEEIRGNPAPERKIWRAQLVVERSEPDGIDVSFPSWPLDEAIRIRLSDIPATMHARLEPGFRTYAFVNLGATSSDQLYVSRWEDQ